MKKKNDKKRKKTSKEERQAAFIRKHGTMTHFDIACYNAMTAGMITYGEYLSALEKYKRDFAEIR